MCLEIVTSHGSRLGHCVAMAPDWVTVWEVMVPDWVTVWQWFQTGSLCGDGSRLVTVWRGFYYYILSRNYEIVNPQLYVTQL